MNPALSQEFHLFCEQEHPQRHANTDKNPYCVYGTLNLRETATSQDLSRVGSDFGRARGHGDGEGKRERGWRWSPRRAYSASPPTIEFLQMV